METHDTNRLVAVTFEPEESPSPPQTPRRLRPAPQGSEESAITAHKIQVEDDERKFDHETTWRSCCVTVDRRKLLRSTGVRTVSNRVLYCAAQPRLRLCHMGQILARADASYWGYASGAQAPRLARHSRIFF